MLSLSEIQDSLRDTILSTETAPKSINSPIKLFLLHLECLLILLSSKESSALN
jgi:hypothetical protein